MSPMRWWLQRRSPAGPGAALSVMIFHRVRPVSDPLCPEEVDAVRFDRLCAWLASWFQVLPLDEAVQRLKAGTLPARALSITFDDGYADNAEVALPILQRHGLCATFFIATGYLDGGRMWNDTLIEAARTAAVPAIDLADVDGGTPCLVPLNDVAQRRQALSTLLMRFKYQSPQRREQLVQEVADRLKARLPADLMLRSDAVRTLQRQGMQIGAHTVSHPILATLDEAQARAEIQGSRQALMAITGEPVGLFAYPNGKPGQDYSAANAELVRSLGFDAAVTTAPGVSHAGSNLHQLPRFSPWRTDKWRFGQQLAANLQRRSAALA